MDRIKTFTPANAVLWLSADQRAINDQLNRALTDLGASAEIDLLLELGGQRGTWAIEIKRGLSAKPQRGFYQALEDVQPARAFVVHAGEDSYPISEDIEAIGLRELAGLLSRKANDGE